MKRKLPGVRSGVDAMAGEGLMEGSINPMALVLLSLLPLGWWEAAVTTGTVPVGASVGVRCKSLCNPIELLASVVSLDTLCRFSTTEERCSSQ